jgi:hypothetical protein
MCSEGTGLHIKLWHSLQCNKASLPHLKFMTSWSAPVNKHTGCSATRYNMKLTFNNTQTNTQTNTKLLMPSKRHLTDVLCVELTTKTLRTIKLLPCDVNNLHSLKELVNAGIPDMRIVRNVHSVRFATIKQLFVLNYKSQFQIISIAN